MALTKTTSIDTIDAWQAVTAGTAVVGNADDISDAYDALLYLEIAIIEAVAHDGAEAIVEVSYADDEWVQLTTVKGTAETPATTTINDADVQAGESSLTLTAAGADFNVVGRKWFIKDGTIANSEAVRTLSVSGNAVTLCQDLIRAHADGLNVYDRVDEWAIKLPTAAAQVRTIVNNVDADSDVAFTTRISKVTAL